MLEGPAIVLTCVALFGYVNYRYLKLPLTVGLVLIALSLSLVLILLDYLFPQVDPSKTVQFWLENIDFNRTLMQGMLSFLLFAGALHVNLKDLIDSKLHVSTLASFGVVISTLINGLGFYLLTKLFGFNTDLMICLVFGAIVSPTDPVAVLAMLKRTKVPKRLEATIAGESLFNDGIAVVLYSLLVTITFGTISTDGQNSIGTTSVLSFFVKEVFGGAFLGLTSGYISFLLLRKMDDYVVEIIITLALVTGAYSLALYLHVSGPIAMVVAGVFIGNTGRQFAMSEKTREHVTQFWHLVDEILNAALFVLIGFEVVMLTFNINLIALSLIAIVISLFARLSAVGLPITVLNPITKKEKGDITILTWAGLRGGISIALALSLPSVAEKPIIMTATYAVVVFTILIQGLSIERLILHFHGNKKAE